MQLSTFTIGPALMLKTALAGPIITIQTADAANNPVSPNYTTWCNNAIQALLTGTTSAGTVNTPGFFTQQSSFQPGEMIAS